MNVKLAPVVAAIDPSVRSCGMALFKGNVLIAAERTQNDPSGDLGRRIRMMACTVALRISMYGAPAVLASEWPQIYVASKSKGDPNDLIAMAGVVGGVMGALNAHGQTCELRLYQPAEWIGQLPKSTRGSAKASPRAQRILSRLSPGEAALVPDQHDIIDAVGIGLHTLGRLGVRRVYSNGTD